MKLNYYKQLLFFRIIMILFTISLLLILSLGYTFSQEVHITKTETMELTTSYSNIICYGQPTKIQSSVNGGREPYIYTYFKLNGYNNDTIYSGYDNSVNIFDGYYRVRVTDSNGKTIETKVEGKTWSWLRVFDYTTPMKPIFEITQPNREDSHNGKIIITDIKNGVSPYTYYWGGIEDYDNEIKRLSIGYYPLTITDSRGCVFNDTIILKKYKKSITKVNKSLLENDTITISEENIELGQSYPNPIINPSKIEYLIPKNTKGIIDFMDVNGKILYSFVLDPNNYYISIYRDNFDYGVYYYSLYVEGKLFETKQLVVF